MRHKIIIIFLAFLVFSPLRGFSAGMGEDRIIAVVNDDVVTQSELKEVLAMFYMQLSTQYSGPQLDEEMVKIERVALNRLIEDKLILAEAKKQQIRLPEGAVEQRLAQMRKRFGDEEEFQRTLIEQGLTISDLRRRTTNQLMMAIVVEDNVKSRIKVSPVEITAYYQADKKRFNRPASAEVDSIFSPSRERIRDAHIALEQGEDFSSVAKRFSQGRPLGVVNKGELLPELEQAIFSLQPQQISRVIPAGKGFYIFRLLKITPASRRPLSEVEGEIREIILRQKTEKRFKRWIKGLRDKAYIVIK